MFEIIRKVAKKRSLFFFSKTKTNCDKMTNNNINDNNNKSNIYNNNKKKILPIKVIK